MEYLEESPGYSLKANHLRMEVMFVCKLCILESIVIVSGFGYHHICHNDNVNTKELKITVTCDVISIVSSAHNCNAT